MEFWLEKSNAKQTRKFWLFCFMASYNNTNEKNENKQQKTIKVSRIIYPIKSLQRKEKKK